MNEEILREFSEIDIKIQQLIDTNERQNARIDKLERMQDNLTSLTISVKELTLEVKNMVSEVASQNTRIRNLENKDGEKWQKVITAVISAVVGGLITLGISGFFGG